jgi:methyltransferase (TIGR00027 family)
MQPHQPSRTALRVARLRARHQISPRADLFRDPFAVRILGEGEPAPGDLLAEDEHTRRLRLFVAIRSRFAEDALEAAVARGVRQAVVLGAGLDTLSLRNPHAGKGLHVFEVDHPATQGWKRERLAAAGLSEPETATFVPVDFERQSLAEELATAGYRLDAAGFFVWLGVVPYVTHDAISETLRFIVRVPGSEVVLDYAEPAEGRGTMAQAAFNERAAHVARLGEPWVSFFDPPALAALLRRIGFDEIEDLDGSRIASRYFDAPAIRPARSGAHLIGARRTA